MNGVNNTVSLEIAIFLNNRILTRYGDQINEDQQARMQEAIDHMMENLQANDDAELAPPVEVFMSHMQKYINQGMTWAATPQGSKYWREYRGWAAQFHAHTDGLPPTRLQEPEPAVEGTVSTDDSTQVPVDATRHVFPEFFEAVQEFGAPTEEDENDDL